MFEAEVIAVNNGYQCRYTPTIMDGPVFRWSHDNQRGADFEISASRNGVMISGHSPCLVGRAVSDLEDILDIARIAADALARNDRDTDRVKRMIVHYAEHGEPLLQ